ncbi:MAG: helix-turn-helix domain-containing protein [Kiritimatiellae bacterium]|nr:helix-turn-helix domain-containing protein [Kiritimatiellia bacterium]MDD4341998.1 helix-turn-helix domain-containing protein [Kiritimatiellia bacterium]MDY0148823.1 helix-turn-helix domain-containing protein [Kiritimatiellia bacterium]
MALSPTLWRTARVVAGETRLELLRHILAEPGLSVTELADSLDLSLSRASQELRRLQSRGLVRASPSGARVHYSPVPDPLVASARPILEAMEKALAETAPDDVAPLIATARAFSHARRLAIIQELIQHPRSIQELQRLLKLSGMAAHRHLQVLQEAGLVRRQGTHWKCDAGKNPLAQCMIRLLKKQSQKSGG